MKNKIVRVVLGFSALVLCLAWIAGGPTVRTTTAEASALAGKGEVIRGELEVIAECEESEGRILYFVNTEKERLSVTFDSEPAEELKTGMHVSMRGTRSADEFRAEHRSLEITAQTDASAELVAGEIKVLVFLVNFQNDTRTPYTIEQANNLMFNQANSSSVTNYYREASYGQAWIAGDTVGWYTLPMDASTSACDQNSTIATLARNAATSAGVNVNNYAKHMFVFPNMGCSYAGRGSLGGRDSWIDGSLVLRTTAHELGHNVGLYHSQAMRCSDIISGTCTSTEYGHNSDMVGQSGVTGHYHPYQKERLGWLSHGAGIVTVQGAGTYTISGLSVQDNNPKALRILKSGSAYYYVEFRRPVGFDSFVSSNSNTMNGVLITQNSSGSSNYLLDMVPSTTSWSDAALKVGESFTDPNTNMTIGVVSVSSSGAVVNVSYGTVPCVMSSPTVSANPSAVQWIAPGSSVSYTMTVTNNNTSNCQSNTFNVGASVPAGWSSTSTQVSVAPGGSASAAVTVTSPASASGAYSAMLSASNSGQTGYYSSLQRDISVLASLSVTALPSQAIYSAGATVVLSGSVSANGSPVPGATVTFEIQKPRGSRKSSSVSGTAVTGANGVATFTYRLNKKQDPLGVYMVNANAGVNGVYASGSTSFEVR
jgi:hypothetical protein